MWVPDRQRVKIFVVPLSLSVAATHYKLELTSIAKFVDEKYQDRYDSKKREENVSVNFTSYTFPNALANTHYTVKVCPCYFLYVVSRGTTLLLL